MSQKTNNNQFLNLISSVGTFAYKFIILQILWVLYSLKGFIILGVFPATASIVQVFYRYFKEEEDIDFSMYPEFKEAYNTYFKRANQIGYIFLLIFSFLYIDLRISNVFIQSIILHTLLIFLILIVLAFSLYGFTVMVRYDLSLKDIFKQSFFISLSVPTFTIAAMIGGLLVGRLMYEYVFLLAFFGVPLFFLPIVWFTYTGCLKAEERREQLDKEQE